MLAKLFSCFLLLIFSLQLYSQDVLKQHLQAIIDNKKVTVGIAVLFEGKQTIVINDSLYPMLSTFKFPVALAMLRHMELKQLPLDTEIQVKKADLHPNTYSPLRELHPEGNFQISLGELIQYSVSQSDNNACDILIEQIGGCANIQQYIDKLGIRDMYILSTEDMMHRKPADQHLNCTRPLSACVLLEKFLEKKLLSPVYHEFLKNTLIATSTGSNKLKGRLPQKTVVGHKTGSSDRNAQGMKLADNDIGFVYLPDGSHYTIAVFVTNSMEDDATNADIIARISKAVYDYYSQHPTSFQ